MRQRLGIARALVNDPEVVFFDEPTLGLDPAGQRQVLALIEGVARDRGATVLLSTHFLGEVEDACARVVILNRGRVVAEGTVAEVTRKAAAPRRGRFRVPAEQRERALEVLGHIGAAQPLEGRPDWVVVNVDDAQVSEAARVLADAGIPLLGFEREGARLSDAFLSMTEEK
jgi:ABC-2 type transport system ATP-binding protein